MRQGKWKLVAVHNGPWELYDIDADRVEMNDLSKKHPEKLREMTQMYEAWAKRCEVVPWAELPPAAQNRPARQARTPAR